MARKRMIDPSFWDDEKVGQLEPCNRLLFMGLISQADDEGRMNGHPALIRSAIFPYDEEITISTIDKWLGRLHELGMIKRYEINGQKFLALINFLKHQTINRPQPSKLPPPPDDGMREQSPIIEQSLNDHGRISDDSRLKEEKLREEKGREDNMAGVVVENPFTVFQNEGFGTISTYIREEISTMSEEYGDKWLCDAMRVSVKKGKRKLSFVEGILKNWKADGRDAYEREKELQAKDLTGEEWARTVGKAAGFGGGT